MELQNKDLWIRPTDVSWHFHLLVTIRELPFKNDRGRAMANMEARDEAKKRKTKKNKKSDQTHRDKTWQSHFS